MLYVGVDAHKTTSHITVMDATGKVVKRRRVPSSPLGMREALGDYQEPMKASWRPVTVGGRCTTG
jgi:predicted NBD/HSP70 family sugar kinase